MAPKRAAAQARFGDPMRLRLMHRRLLISLCVAGFAATASAQPAFRLVVDGTLQPWTPPAGWTADSLGAAARHALRTLAEDGYARARIDSTARTDSTVILHATRGDRVPVAKVVLDGATRWPAEDLLGAFDTRAGQPLRAGVLRADIARLLGRYASAGLGLARVRLVDLTLREAGDAPEGLVVRLALDEGRAVRLGRIEVGAGRRTRPAYAARLMDVRLGAPLQAFDPAVLQARLERSGVFSRVGRPEVWVDESGTATLRLDVDERPPGAFDLVLGLQPGAAGERAALVGSGHLLLQHLFGRGQVYELHLNRQPGQVSRVHARASVPLVFGLPLRAEGAFEGTQQDSTFGAQTYRGLAGLGGGGREVLVTLSRETVKPGIAGARVVGGRQRVARSAATFVGVGFALADLDAPLNPRRGYTWETLLERGTRERRLTREESGQALRVGTATRQERLSLTGRFYAPLARRLVTALGVDGYALRSDAYEEGELFRLGGATTLRGYDEDRFRVRYAARGFGEVRFLLDRLSYAFVFAEAAYLDQPEAPGVSSLRGVYPGYGLGAQVATGVGLVLVTYAASPEAGLTAGRVHLGLSFGL